MPGIYIFADNKNSALELLSAGRSLVDAAGGRLSLFLCFDREEANEYIDRGADEILILPPPAEDQPYSAYAPLVVEEIRGGNPDLVLFCATFRGKEIAAHVAGRMKVGLCSGCTALHVNPENKTFEMERLAYGGAGVQRVVCAARPALAAVTPGVFEKAGSKTGRTGEIRNLLPPPPSDLKVIERKARRKQAKEITEAGVIVCPGRGFAKEEDLAMVRELAGLMGGEIGCTRPLSEELRWLPEELCIGLSGVSVKPGLYLGIGVSGQIQHVTGIRNAKVIAAVNKDEKAPIFEAADFGIVGDLYDVVPKLVQALKKTAG